MEKATKRLAIGTERREEKRSSDDDRMMRSGLKFREIESKEEEEEASCWMRNESVLLLD